MGKRLQSWFFFTALMLFLLAAAVSLPVIGARLFGSTQERMEAAVEEAGNRAQAVWAELRP